MRFMIAFLYRYHVRRGWGDLSYFSSLGALVVIIYFNLLGLATLFGYERLMMWWDPSDPIWRQNLEIGLCFFFPCYFVLRFLFPKKKVDPYLSDEDSASVGGLLFAIYVAASIALLAVAMVWFRS